VATTYDLIVNGAFHFHLDTETRFRFPLPAVIFIR
jgi:hypothetical protein